MTDLSPAAQVVWDAWQKTPVSLDIEQSDRDALAAALRAAAFHLSYGHATGSGVLCEDDLLAIAAELEGE